MANWWDAAPLATKAATPAAGANWWEAAPLANEAMSAPTLEPGKDGGPKRLVMDMSKPDRGALDATARGVAQGFTANFGDEIRGLVEASGANADDPASLTKLISGALKYWSGDTKAKEAYDAAVARERDLNKTAEEQHPIASIGGQVGGAVLLPVGAGAGAATLGGRMAAGAGTGAALGAASGAGEGEGGTDTLSKAAMGAGVGGVVGGAAPVVIRGAEVAGQGLAKLAQPIVNNFRGATNVDAEAARRILLARQRDAKSASPGMSEAEFASAKASGSPVINADMGGEATQALARSAANTSPEGRAALEAVTSERYATQNPRISSFLKEKFDFPEPGATLDRLEEAARRANRPAYLRAYSEGANIPFDEGLLQLSQAPVVQDAIRKAMITAKNEAAKLDLPPPKNPFRFDETGRLRPMQDEAGNLMRPNLQFWDIVKRNLDKTGSPEARDWARVLRDHLDDLVPSGSYKEARSGAAKFFGAEDALEAGAKFATMSGRDAISLAEARKGLAKMNPAERKLFETGFVSNLISKVESLRDGQDVVKNIFNSEFARNQIKLAIGETRAAELEAKLLAERAMNGIKTAIQGNSTTVRQWVERGLAGGATGLGGVGTYNMDPQAIGVAALTGAIVAGGKKIDQRVARRVAEMLASDNPKITEAGNKIIAKSGVLREAFRKLDLPSARVGGEQAGAVPPLQAAGVSRAEDQPNVPRPPGQ
jgi:hypothetical protein